MQYNLGGGGKNYNKYQYKASMYYIHTVYIYDNVFESV